MENVFASPDLAYYAPCMPESKMIDKKTIGYSAKGYYEAIRFILSVLPTATPIDNAP